VTGEGLPRLPAFGFPTPSRSGARLQPLLFAGQPGAKRRPVHRTLAREEAQEPIETRALRRMLSDSEVDSKVKGRTI